MCYFETLLWQFFSYFLLKVYSQLSTRAVFGLIKMLLCLNSRKIWVQSSCALGMCTWACSSFKNLAYVLMVLLMNVALVTLWHNFVIKFTSRDLKWWLISQLEIRARLHFWKTQKFYSMIIYDYQSHNFI